MKPTNFIQTYSMEHLKELLVCMTRSRDQFILMCQRTERDFVPDTENFRTSEGAMTVCIEFLTDIIETNYMAYYIQDKSTRRLIDKQINSAENVYKRNSTDRIGKILAA